MLFDDSKLAVMKKHLSDGRDSTAMLHEIYNSSSNEDKAIGVMIRRGMPVITQHIWVEFFTPADRAYLEGFEAGALGGVDYSSSSDSNRQKGYNDARNGRYFVPPIMRGSYEKYYQKLGAFVANSSALELVKEHVKADYKSHFEKGVLLGQRKLQGTVEEITTKAHSLKNGSDEEEWFYWGYFKDVEGWHPPGYNDKNHIFWLAWNHGRAVWAGKMSFEEGLKTLREHKFMDESDVMGGARSGGNGVNWASFSHGYTCFSCQGRGHGSLKTRGEVGTYFRKIDEILGIKVRSELAREETYEEFRRRLEGQLGSDIEKDVLKDKFARRVFASYTKALNNNEQMKLEVGGTTYDIHARLDVYYQEYVSSEGFGAYQIAHGLKPASGSEFEAVKDLPLFKLAVLEKKLGIKPSSTASQLQNWSYFIDRIRDAGELKQRNGLKEGLFRAILDRMSDIMQEAGVKISRGNFTVEESVTSFIKAAFEKAEVADVSLKQMVAEFEQTFAQELADEQLKADINNKWNDIYYTMQDLWQDDWSNDEQRALKERYRKHLAYKKDLQEFEDYTHTLLYEVPRWRVYSFVLGTIVGDEKRVASLFEKEIKEHVVCPLFLSAGCKYKDTHDLVGNFWKAARELGKLEEIGIDEYANDYDLFVKANDLNEGIMNTITDKIKQSKEDWKASLAPGAARGAVRALHKQLKEGLMDYFESKAKGNKQQKSAFMEGVRAVFEMPMIGDNIIYAFMAEAIKPLGGVVKLPVKYADAIAEISREEVVSDITMRGLDFTAGILKEGLGFVREALNNFNESASLMLPNVTENEGVTHVDFTKQAVTVK